MTFRRYVQLFAGALVLFLCLNFVVWHFWTERILTTRYGEGGDLARLGYLPAFKLYRQNVVDLPRRHISLRQYQGQRVDLLTLGDSFSNGVGGGKNRFYQDYIASYSDITVLNIGPYTKYQMGRPFLDPLTTLWMLVQAGEIDRIAPRAVLVSISAKHAVEFLAHPLETVREPVEKLRDPNSYQSYGSALEGPEAQQLGTGSWKDFLTLGNVKFLYWNALYHLTGKTDDLVAQVRLTRPFFSVQGDRLLYYRRDVKEIAGYTRANLELLNGNLNLVARELGRRGIKLYFMPCVDKFDLYRPYVTDPKLPVNPFFDILRTLPREYVLIDTKEILSRQAEKGELDLFFPDDTHWSWKAAQSVFESFRFR